MTPLQEYVTTLGQLGEPSGLVAHARAIIKAALAKDVRWAISFSGGKDSLVMLELVLEQAPDPDIVWFDDGWDYPETTAFVAETEGRLGRHILRLEFPHLFYGYGPGAHEHDLSQKEYHQRYGGSFIGMRKDESATRHYTLTRRGGLYKTAQTGQWHCCPLMAWNAEDVWRFIGARRLAYNAAYDRLHDVCGISAAGLRVGPLTAHMVYQYGILVVLQRGWPDLANTFLGRHRELRANL